MKNLRWMVYNSVSSIPDGIWDKKVAGGHPARSSNFLRTVEKAFPDRDFHYFLLYDDKNGIIGCCLITLSPID